MVKGDKSRPRKPEGLEGSPGHLMHRALQRMLEAYAAEAGADAPTHRQYVLLEATAQASEGGGLSQADLVRLTGIDRSTLAELAARMTTRGWLVRERSEADGRARSVTLSDEGRAVLEKVRPAVASADKRFLAALPKARREKFVEILTELAAADAGEKAEARLAAKAARKLKRAARGKTKI